MVRSLKRCGTFPSLREEVVRCGVHMLVAEARPLPGTVCVQLLQLNWSP